MQNTSNNSFFFKLKTLVVFVIFSYYRQNGFWEFQNICSLKFFSQKYQKSKSQKTSTKQLFKKYSKTDYERKTIPWSLETNGRENKSKLFIKSGKAWVPRNLHQKIHHTINWSIVKNVHSCHVETEGETKMQTSVISLTLHHVFCGFYQN